MKSKTTPRAKRIERLTKRPPIFRFITEDDWPIIAVAYERGAFPFSPDMDAMALRHRIEYWERLGYKLTVVEDDNQNFRAGRGLVAMIVTKWDGWRVEPELFKFPWATKFNVVRGMVAYLLEMKRSRFIGVCRVECKESSKQFMERLTELKLLFRCGYIPNGYPDSALWSYNISGKKQKVG